MGSSNTPDIWRKVIRQLALAVEQKSGIRFSICHWDGLPLSYNEWREPRGFSAHQGLLATGRKNEAGDRTVTLSGRLGVTWLYLAGSCLYIEASC